ncbi:MAG TPA: ATP phosphoribosyltransferase [Bacteroidales bacterium]|mgnify:CR=1 FL=1|jgi:ATP phosphoribosyltransferase|nr:ATP phosphoribosyltransferase [Bacteroidales bacterium]
MERLRLAIQKKGRLNEKSIELIKKCGIKINSSGNILSTSSENFPIDVLFLRDDDIPGYIADGVADIGIVGQNEIDEHGANVKIIENLGFAKCRLSIAVPRDTTYRNINDLQGKTIATSYPNILQAYLDKNNLNAEIHTISGSVEIAPAIGLTDAICDLVSTGSTLLFNGLIEVEEIYTSAAVLAATPFLTENKQRIVDKFMQRISSVKHANAYKYILLNAPNKKIKDIIKILPGIKSPTVMPLAIDGWSSIHTVIPEDAFWEKINELKQYGAEGILVTPIEKIIE